MSKDRWQSWKIKIQFSNILKKKRIFSNILRIPFNYFLICLFSFIFILALVPFLKLILLKWKSVILKMHDTHESIIKIFQPLTKSINTTKKDWFFSFISIGPPPKKKKKMFSRDLLWSVIKLSFNTIKLYNTELG